MKNSFNLLAIVMFATPYTMMHASASEEQPTLSVYDELEQHKQKCIRSFIALSEQWLINQTTNFDVKASRIEERIRTGRSLSIDSDNSDFDITEARLEHLNDKAAPIKAGLAKAYEQSILTIQQMQINEATVAKLRIAASRSRSHSR